MKYQVTYRLRHPEFLPSLSVALVDASTHAELEIALVRLITKWRAQGYTVQVLRVIAGKTRKSSAAHPGRRSRRL